LGACLCGCAHQGWRAMGDGDWRIVDESPVVMWQGNREAATSAVLRDVPGHGNVWRCLVEPGPATTEAGIWFAAPRDLAGGFLLTLVGADEGGGVALRDAAGRLLWEDEYARWTYYTPYLLEGIVEPDRIRVQVLRWDRETLVAQSDWIETDIAAGRFRHMALHTTDSSARFSHWERSKSPSSPIMIDSPTKLRVTSDEGSGWAIVGNGEWQWATGEGKVLCQTADVERSTALKTVSVGPERTWRCRVTVEPGTGGAGMAMLADRAAERGFLVWLGGRPGAGGLMLYRLPLETLWSGAQECWRYDTEYVLEGTVSDGVVAARLLGADGVTVIAASPAFNLTEEERTRSGYLGFQTWKGRARFSAWSVRPSE